MPKQQPALADHWLLDALIDGVVLVDGEWRVFFVNQAAERILHVRRGELLGKRIGVDLPEPPPERMRVYREVMRTRRPRMLRDVALQGATFEGRVFDGEVHPSPGGGIALVFRDITARRGAEQAAARLAPTQMQLESALGARNRFYTAMSHELRTPLNAVLGYNDLLLSGVYGPLNDAQTHGVERSQRAARHLLEIVDDILDISRLEAGKMAVEPVEVELRALLHDLCVTAQPMVEAHDASLRVSATDCPERIVTDPRRVRQVLLNLISNAAKFGRGHPVELRCAGTADGGVRLEVVDRGKGVPPADRERIFEEFVQLETADTAEGTGLGLPIARRVAALLGGRLELESEVGAGSTFRLVLPAAKA